jgi:phage baseplate assembly protein V
LSAQVDVTAEPGYRSVRAHRWDAATATSASPVVSRSDARARVPLTVDGSVTGGGGERVLIDVAARDDSGPVALAGATLDVMAAGEVTASFVAEGDARIRPGRRVVLRGIAPDLAGTYTVADAVHDVDRDGYTVTASTRPPPIPSTPAGSVVTLGTVSDVSDPANLARVRVRLDAYGALESGWAPVVLAAAGPGKGAVLLPDVGDRVAVDLPHGDPDQALVLGGLFGTGAPPQDPVAGGRIRRWAIQGADGQRLVFDGEGQRLRLQGHNGSYVELGDDRTSISAVTDMVIEAPGRTITIRAKAVDFEEAG